MRASGLSASRAIALIPEFVGTHINGAAALIGLERFAEAEAPLRQALTLKPDLAETHNNLGATLQTLNRPSEALASYERALDLRPDFVEAHNNLGTLLKDLGRLDEAVASFRRALALAPETYYPLAAVYEEAGRNLDLAKSSDRDCIYLLGRILEWRHLSDAADLKDTVTRLVHDFRMSRQFLYQLRSFYRREAYVGAAGASETQRTWRFQRRFNRILSGTRDREFQKLRTHLITEMMGRKTAEVKLRPAGLVALEWARLVTEV